MGCTSSRSTSFNPTRHNHQFDLIVIGGGSGGISCAREAAKLGARVALLDYVDPSPKGSQWGLGGTCVNVGCIPKRLFHQSNLIKDYIKDSPLFGWSGMGSPTFTWGTLVKNVQDFIDTLNFGYRIAIARDNIQYYNARGSFKDIHTVKMTSSDGQSDEITGQCIVIAVGGRPKYLNIPGGTAQDALCITSDDIFSLQKPPGATLCIGAGYISVECAGFLAGFGNNVTIMARSKVLQGFDEPVVNLLVDNLADRNVNIELGWNIKEIIKTGDDKLSVKYEQGGSACEQDFNTILLAVGREASIEKLNLGAVPGVKVTNGEIQTNEAECTGVPNIFAIGDCAYGRPKLTPTAIIAGKYLARRLYGKSGYGRFTETVNYSAVPTTIFTPIEYSCCGLSEYEAITKYGESNIEIYHKTQTPPEFSLNKRDGGAIYAKLVCLKGRTPENEKVLGIHYFGPNAGEVIIGFSMAISRQCSKKEFNQLIGVHPTCAEVFCDMNTTKRSGASYSQRKC